MKYLTRSLGKRGTVHEVTITFAGSAATFVDGPDDEALAPPHVSGGKDAFDIGVKLFEGSRDIGAGVGLDP